MRKVLEQSSKQEKKQPLPKLEGASWVHYIEFAESYGGKL